MAYALGVLFVIVVGVPLSIALHEIGHLVPAKRFGVKCTQYMVGFGPTVWSRKVGETEYGIKAIPLGGYVRMIGMFPPAREGARPSRGRLGELINQARDDAQRDIGPGDESRLFYTRSVPQRLVIMLGGPTMNLIIAVVLLSFIVLSFGLPAQTTTLREVYGCVLPASAPANAQCTSADQVAPAAAAGLRPGDTVTKFNGKAVSTWEDVRSQIQAHGGDPVVLTVQRDGQVREVSVTPVTAKRPQLTAEGTIAKDASGQTKLTEVGFLGVSPSTEMVRQPVSAVPGFLGNALWQTATLVVTVPEKMVGVTQAAFGSAERDPEGPVSIVGIGRFAGEVASVESATGTTITTGERFANLLMLIASLNLALFVFNLVPLLPLDGGHVAGALWEGLRRRVASLFNRPDPGPVDIAKALPVAYGVATMLIAMSLLLIYADIVRPISLNG